MSENNESEVDGSETTPRSVSVEDFEDLSRRVEQLEQRLRAHDNAQAQAAAMHAAAQQGAHGGWHPGPQQAAAMHAAAQQGAHGGWHAGPQQAAAMHAAAQQPMPTAPQAGAPGPHPGHQAGAAYPMGQSPTAPQAPKPVNSTTVIALVGALIFLLGAGYFLYWSIEKGWVTPGARVALGTVIGLGLCVRAVYMMRSQAQGLAFSLYLAGMGSLIFSVYYGAMVASLFAPGLGFAVVTVAVVFSALLAVYHESGTSLGIAYCVGLASPLVFSSGSGRYDLLMGYLLVLMASTLVVFYRMKRGGAWHFPRLAALLGTWFLAAFAASSADSPQLYTLLGLSVLAYALSLAWIWLPKHPERPRMSPAMWLYACCMSSAVIGILWARLDLPGRGMGGVFLGQAALAAALIVPVRRRLGRGADDWVLYFSALVQLMIAAAALIQTNPVVAVWAVLALGFSGAAYLTHKRELPDAGILYWCASLATLWASFGWLYALFASKDTTSPFINLFALTGVLVVASWVRLASMAGSAKKFAFVIAQIMFNLTLAYEVWRLAGSLGATKQVAAISSTVLFALSASAQYIKGIVSTDKSISKAWSYPAYVLFGIAAAKLLLFDLSTTGNIVRAIAAVGIGGIFIAAAMIANKLKPE